MISPTSSCELDPIPTGLVKEHVDDFAPYITGIVNKSLRDATFPDYMQYALVKPTFKTITSGPTKSSKLSSCGQFDLSLQGCRARSIDSPTEISE